MRYKGLVKLLGSCLHSPRGRETEGTGFSKGYCGNPEVEGVTRREPATRGRRETGQGGRDGGAGKPAKLF